MPLPSGGTWPPRELAPITARLDSWSAWYSGDPDQLSGTYGGVQDTRAPDFFKPSQYRGGVVGAIARWFWGQPTPSGEKRTKLHVPVAGDIASASADLLYSEPPTLTVDDPKTQERLDDLADDGMHATLLESAEIGSALGGAYLRACWDTAVSDKPWLGVVHADAAVPEWRGGRLSAVTFWRTLRDDKSSVIRHLERHEPGMILHGLYKGSADELGHRIPLTEMPETTGLTDEVTTGLTMLTADYLPNMKPSRIWRSVPAGAHLGRSDYSGVEPLMDALDETYSSWMRDIRLGKARVFAPSAYMQSQGPGNGAYFDADQEIFTTVNAMPGPGLELTPQQFAIRTAEHRDTAYELLTRIVGGAGYSGQTFGLTGDVAMTATEAKARERRSFVTRSKKIVYQRPPLARMLEVLLAVDALVFRSGVTPERPTIEFGDSVSEDAKSQAETLDLLRRAQAASTDTLVRMLHPDWDDDERIAEEVERIDSASKVPDPFAAPPFGAQPPDDEGEPVEGEDPEL